MKAITLLTDIMSVLNGDRKIITKTGYHQIEVHETQLDDFNKRLEEAIKEVRPEPAVEPPKPAKKKTARRKKVPTPAPEHPEISEAIRRINRFMDSGQRIQAIKEIRTVTGWGLKEAKECSDVWETTGALRSLKDAMRDIIREREAEDILNEPDEWDW